MTRTSPFVNLVAECSERSVSIFPASVKLPFAGSNNSAEDRAALPLLHDVSLMLFDTGMRPEECHCLRWDNVNWDSGRNGVLLITEGKTKAARRVLPLFPRVRTLLENRWKLAGQPGEGWVWPADTKDGHINHDSLKLQHKKALKLAKVRPFEVYSIRHTFLTRLGESGCPANARGVQRDRLLRRVPQTVYKPISPRIPPSQHSITADAHGRDFPLTKAGVNTQNPRVLPMPRPWCGQPPVAAV